MLHHVSVPKPSRRISRVLTTVATVVFVVYVAVKFDPRMTSRIEPTAGTDAVARAQSVLNATEEFGAFSVISVTEMPGATEGRAYGWASGDQFARIVHYKSGQCDVVASGLVKDRKYRLGFRDGKLQLMSCSKNHVETSLDGETWVVASNGDNS